MALLHVAVIVSFAVEQLRGNLQLDDAALILAPNVQPENSLEVILLVLVNSRKIRAAGCLRIHEAKAPWEDKQKAAKQIDSVGQWKRQRLHMGPTKAKADSAASK